MCAQVDCPGARTPNDVIATELQRPTLGEVTVYRADGLPRSNLGLERTASALAFRLVVSRLAWITFPLCMHTRNRPWERQSEAENNIYTYIEASFSWDIYLYVYVGKIVKKEEGKRVAEWMSKWVRVMMYHTLGHYKWMRKRGYGKRNWKMLM